LQRLKSKTRIYSIQHIFSSIAMIVALLWLTISLPYIYKAQLKYAEISSAATGYPSPAAEENTNPFSGLSEEKAPSATGINEEYLHHHDFHDAPWKLIEFLHGDFVSTLFPVFHGELLSPPPEV